MKKSKIRLTILNDKELRDAISIFYENASDKDLMTFHQIITGPLPSVIDGDEPTPAKDNQEFNCDFLYPINNIPDKAYEVIGTCKERQETIPGEGNYLSLLYDDESNTFRATFVKKPYEEIWNGENRGSLLCGKEVDINSIRHALQVVLDNNKKFVPKALKKRLRDAIDKVLSKDSPFLFYRIVATKEEVSYITQDRFFKKLGDLYEEVDLNTKIQDIKLNGIPLDGEKNIEDVFEYICKEYRDTYTYATIPGMKEVSIKDGEEISKLIFPDGKEYQIEDWMRKATRQSCKMVHPPKAIGEHSWEKAQVKSEADLGINGSVILKDNKPVHAYLLGKEKLTSANETNLLTFIEDDFILKHVIQDTPQQIDVIRYALISEYAYSNGDEIFSVPIATILSAQKNYNEKILEKTKKNAILQIPEHPTPKDLLSSIKEVVSAYQVAGLCIKSQQFKDLLFSSNFNEKSR